MSKQQQGEQQQGQQGEQQQGQQGEQQQGQQGEQQQGQQGEQQQGQQGEQQQGQQGEQQQGQQGEQQQGQQGEQQQGQQQETFTREYVERLRTEAGDHRAKAKALAAELHEYRVKSLGVLADARDLPYSSELDTLEKVQAAIDALIEDKPHLKARRAGGDVGQGSRPAPVDSFSLAGLLRSNA